MEPPSQPQDVIQVEDNTGNNFNEEVKVNHVIVLSKPSQILLSKLIEELSNNVGIISRRTRILRGISWSLYITTMMLTLSIIADPQIMVGSISVTRLLGIGIACCSIITKSSGMDIKISKRLKTINTLQALLRKATLLEINFSEQDRFILDVEKIWEEFNNMFKPVSTPNSQENV